MDFIPTLCKFRAHVVLTLYSAAFPHCHFLSPHHLLGRRNWSHPNLTAFLCGNFLLHTPPISVEVPEAQCSRVTLLEVTQLVRGSALCPPGRLWGQAAESSSGTVSLILPKPPHDPYFLLLIGISGSPRKLAVHYSSGKEYLALPNLCSSNGNGIPTGDQQCFPGNWDHVPLGNSMTSAWDPSWIWSVATHFASSSIKWEFWCYLVRISWDE